MTAFDLRHLHNNGYEPTGRFIKSVSISRIKTEAKVLGVNYEDLLPVLGKNRLYQLYKKGGLNVTLNDSGRANKLDLRERINVGI